MSKPKVSIAIGVSLKQARLDAGMSQRDLSRATGMSVGQISQIETGVRLNPNFATVERIAAALHLSLDALVSRKYSPLREFPKSERDRLATRREVEALRQEAQRLISGLDKLLKRLDSESGKDRRKRTN